MIKTKNYLAQLTITEILAIVSIVISLFVLVRDYHRSEQIDQISYTNSAVQFRPKLEIINHPSIDEGINFATKLKHFDSLGTKVYNASPTGLGINISLKCVNIGNSLARILNTFYTDTVSGEAKLRATLMDKDSRQGSMVPVSLNA